MQTYSARLGIILRKYWFYTLNLLYLFFDLGVLISGFISLATSGISFHYRTDTPIERAITTIEYLYFGLNIINGIYLTTYGFLYANTIVGSFAFQQLLALILIGLLISYNRLQQQILELYYMEKHHSLLFYMSCGLHASVSVVLWGLLLAAHLRKNLELRKWIVDVEDLASQKPSSSGGVSWRGAPRDLKSEILKGACAKGPGDFILNMFIRRVRAVETKRYAFCQHLFALSALALLLTRTITLLSQLANEELPSRTVIGACVSTGHLQLGGMYVIVRHPELADKIQSYNPDSVNLTHQVSIGFQKAEPTNWYTPMTNSCPLIARQMAVTDRGSHVMADWLHIYHCNGDNIRTPTAGFVHYNISTANQNDLRDTYLPSLRISPPTKPVNMLVPYLVPPIEPIPGTSAFFTSRFAERRFISSSPLRDAVTGSKPTHNAIELYLWSQVHSQPIALPNGSDTLPLSTGYIRTPRPIDAALLTPRSKLEKGVRGNYPICEIIEEYRTGGTFDVLASIGGLLALLQGLHVFLFGRPLFWGMFGAKIITPFGIFGRLASKGFRRRLYEHYYAPNSSDPSLAMDDGQASRGIDMTRFLLDYVVDLGPAELAARETKDRHLDSPRGQTELPELELPLFGAQKEQARNNTI